jgi:hypothetical protein
MCLLIANGMSNPVSTFMAITEKHQATLNALQLVNPPNINESMKLSSSSILRYLGIYTTGTVPWTSPELLHTSSLLKLKHLIKLKFAIIMTQLRDKDT